LRGNWYNDDIGPRTACGSYRPISLLSVPGN